MPSYSREPSNALCICMYTSALHVHMVHTHSAKCKQAHGTIIQSSSTYHDVFPLAAHSSPERLKRLKPCTQVSSSGYACPLCGVSRSESPMRHQTRTWSSSPRWWRNLLPGVVHSVPCIPRSSNKPSRHELYCQVLPLVNRRVSGGAGQ